MFGTTWMSDVPSAQWKTVRRAPLPLAGGPDGMEQGWVTGEDVSDAGRG